MISAPKLRTVTYSRMSTDMQEASIKRQHKDYPTAYARHNMVPVRDYVDEGKSGDSKDRDAFNRMMRDAEMTHDFEAILCWDLDRFSRMDTLDVTQLWRQLRDANIRLFSVHQGELKFDDMGSLITAIIHAEAAHAFLRKNATNTTSGLLQAAQAGKWCNGDPPYGFQCDGVRLSGRLILHESRAETMRWVFAEIVNHGASINSLCKQMDAKNVKTPSGAPKWNPMTLFQLVRNPIMYGCWVYGRRPSGKRVRIRCGELETADRRGFQPILQSKADCIVTENCFPAIVDKETFDKAQDVLNRRGFGKVIRTSYTLKGLLVCGSCGKQLVGHSHRRTLEAGEKKYCFYKCSNYKRLAVADCPEGCRYSVAREEVEGLVVDAVQQQFLTPEKIEACGEMLRRILDRQAGGRDGEVLAASKRLASQEAILTKLESRMGTEDDALWDSLVRQIKVAKASRDAAKLEMSALKSIGGSNAKSSAQSAKELIARLGALRVAINDPRLDQAKLRAALNEIVEKVIVKPREGRHYRAKHVLREIEVIYRTDICSPNNVFQMEASVKCDSQVGYFDILPKSTRIRL